MASAGKTVVLMLLLAVLLVSGLELNAETLASSPAMTILGGLVCAKIFGVLVTLVSALESMMGIENTRWIEVIFCQLVALTCAATVHGVCITTCFLFSAVGLYFMVQMSNNTYGTAASQAAAKADGKKKRRRN